MMILGVILMVIGYVMPNLLVEKIGWVVLFVGAILLVYGYGGRHVAGRRYWF